MTKRDVWQDTLDGVKAIKNGQGSGML